MSSRLNRLDDVIKYISARVGSGDPVGFPKPPIRGLTPITRRCWCCWWRFRRSGQGAVQCDLPACLVIPMGCDIIRIDRYDRWHLIVGGNPLIASASSKEKERIGLSGLGSGFNNPFNVYAWQIQEYQNRLYISTFDDSSNMEVILHTLLTNRVGLEQLIGQETTNLLIKIYKTVVEILRAIRYPVGFDLYISEDGVHFNSVFLNGLNNPNNYGGRILYVDSSKNLYIGTANPFQGCEVWKISKIDECSLIPCDENHYQKLWEAKKIINDNYSVIEKNMPAILKLLPKDFHIII
ncbi:MAG: hypothetical protein PHD36_04190 [Desulfotomaculaceae bacterium]|nr:hypothetical protein [Desulfotomaculaceae bacterium]